MGEWRVWEDEKQQSWSESLYHTTQQGYWTQINSVGGDICTWGRGTGNEEAGEVVPQWEGDPKSSGDDDCGGFSLWLPQDLKAGMGMMALNKEEDLGGQNHGNSIVVGIGMIEWEVEAATTTAAATVPGWILVCELLQFNMGNVELPIQVSTCSLTHISPWMQ